YYSLRIWHGFNPALALSVIALVSGILLYVCFRNRINANPRGAPPFLHRFQARRLFDSLMARLVMLARFMERRFSTRALQPQLRLLVLVPLLIGLIIVATSGGLSISTNVQAVDPFFALLWLVGGVCAVGAAYQAKYHRFVALILMGGAGIVCCLTFVWLSAPDLAITQLLVEIVTTVLLLLGLRWLPVRREDLRKETRRSKIRRGLDLSVAIIAGLAVAALTFAVMTRPAANSISSFF
ncbi:MAG: hydrogen gas-evolving membrane-bound hydrogenase subunit E, partial [Asticcacaulis sp.]